MREVRMLSQDNINYDAAGKSGFELSDFQFEAPDSCIVEDHCLPVRANILESDSIDLRVINTYKRLVINFEEVSRLAERRDRIIELTSVTSRDR